MRNYVSFRCEHDSGKYELWLKDRHAEISEYVSEAFIQKLIRRLRSNKSLVKIHRFRTHMDERSRHNMADALENVLKDQKNAVVG